MMKMTLNLHFVLQLMLHLRMFELALEKNFQSHNKTTLFSGQINMAKLAPPKRFPNLKIRQHPPLLVSVGWSLQSENKMHHYISITLQPATKLASTTTVP